jgi:hypothetical protein
MSDVINTDRMSIESIERAFERHRARNLIRSWRRLDRGGWQVHLHSGTWDFVELRSRREVGLFLAGLISAARAPQPIP